MRKKLLFTVVEVWPKIFYRFLSMQFLVVFMLLCMAQAFAKPLSNNTISVDFSQAALSQALHDIEHKRGYHFTFADNSFKNHKVSLKASDMDVTEGNPDIVGLAETRYVTGYAIKKGLSYFSAHAEGSAGSTGSIVFRATEAYLNYIEASYLKEGVINTKADGYWKAIRKRAGINVDYTVTIAATDMTKEAKNDFAVYSKGQLLTDKTLYNIRRERRVELMAEGMRFTDLKRWRALDQLKTSPYIVEGFKAGGPMQDWYKKTDGTSLLIEAETPGKTANVSKKSESLYLRPYRINLSASNFVRNGYSWAFAYYLDPIAIQHFITTADKGADINTSVIYQNPGWPMEADKGAIN